MTVKPFSQACENNKAAILNVLKTELVDSREVLEVGSGTGQHAVYFAGRLPHVVWQTSDQPQYHAGIKLWLNEAALSNVLAPIALDVRTVDWSVLAYDAVFTANSLHIMAADAAEHFVGEVSSALRPGGLFIAEDLTETDADPDDTEILQIHKMPFVDAIAMVESGEIVDALTIMGLLLAERWIAKND